MDENGLLLNIQMRTKNNKYIKNAIKLVTDLCRTNNNHSLPTDLRNCSWEVNNKNI